MAMAYTQLKQPAQALAQLQQAEAMGFQGGALYFQRGELQYAQGQFAAAMQSYTQALDKPQPASEQELSRRRHAEAAVAARIRPRHRRLPGLLQQKPDSIRNLVGLAMAYIGKNEAPKAIEILNPLIDKRPTAQAFYVRALAQHYLGQNTKKTSTSPCAPSRATRSTTWP
jgi:tetratricopeptide (TPR) repeat protein